MDTKPLYQTYLINLDRATDRLELMQKEFEKCEITYERISAVDAKKMDVSTYKVDNKYDRDLVTGEIGYYLSHIKTLEVFLASKNEFAVIIEDDAIMANDFKPAIENSLSIYHQLPIKHQ